MTVNHYCRVCGQMKTVRLVSPGGVVSYLDAFQVPQGTPFPRYKVEVSCPECQILYTPESVGIPTEGY